MGDPLDWLTRTIGPGIECVTFNAADRIYQEQLKMAAELADSVGCEPEQFWDPHWFPIARASGVIATSCAAPEAICAPILVVEWGTDPDSARPKATSLGAVVALWTTALQEGWWTYDRDTATWERHVECISAEADLSRLA